VQYDYNAPGGNNGQVWKEPRGAEQIICQYDELKRLASAKGEPADGSGLPSGSYGIQPDVDPNSHSKTAAMSQANQKAVNKKCR
jgi:hypothetical protein